MNILDENVLESQRQLLIKWRVPFRQIGYEVGRKGMDDEQIIPFCLRCLARLSSRRTGIITSRGCATPSIAWLSQMSDALNALPLFVVCCGILNATLKPNAWALSFGCHIDDLQCGVSMQKRKCISTGLTDIKRENRTRTDEHHRAGQSAPRFCKGVIDARK